MEPDWKYLDFLNAASQRIELSSTAKRVFNANGVEINDCMMIEDDDILFLSSGENFIEPKTTSNDNKGNDRDKVPNIIGGYKVGKVLGRGGFGVVRIGEHHLTGEKVALKFLRKSDIMSIGAAERTTTEIQCLTTLKHQHIIRLQQHFESPQHVILVFELMEGGDLLKYLVNLNKNRCISSDPSPPLSSPSSLDVSYALSEDEARPLFHQILSAVSFAHNQHICHRDLKLENILLKSNSLALVKIADFGLSDFYRPGATMKSTCGTLSFLAPEVFQGTSNAGPPLDVWSLGVILFAILCGRLPFEGTDLSGAKRPRDAIIKSRIMKCSYKIEEYLSLEAKDLLSRMIKLDPSERATIREILHHCWMRSMSNPHHIDYVSSRSNSISISRDSFEKTEKRSISKEESNNLSLQLDDGMSLSLPLDDGLEISNHVPSPGTLRRSFSAHDKLGFLGSTSVESEVSTSTSPSCKLVPLRRNSSRIDDEEELLGISDNTTRLRPSTVVEGTRRNSSSLLNSQKDDIISSSSENGGKRLSTIPTRRPINISVQLKTGWSEVNSPNENKAGRERKPSIISNESITPKSSDEINISNKSTIVSPSPVSITSRSGSFISGSSPKIVGRRKF